MNHADHAPLSEALAMTRNFLDEFNIIQTKSMFPVSKSVDSARIKFSVHSDMSEEVISLFRVMTERNED